MKGLLTKIIAAFAAVASIGIACQCFAQAERQHDWQREMALSGNDMAAFLNYQPTDGASHEGKVRKAVDPSTVHP